MDCRFCPAVIWQRTLRARDNGNEWKIFVTVLHIFLKKCPFDGYVRSKLAKFLLEGEDNLSDCHASNMEGWIIEDPTIT